MVRHRHPPVLGPRATVLASHRTRDPRRVLAVCAQAQRVLGAIPDQRSRLRASGSRGGRRGGNPASARVVHHGAHARRRTGAHQVVQQRVYPAGEILVCEVLLVKAGKVNAIAVTGPKRTPVLPEVPTVSETNGLKQYEASNWYGLVSSANTPKPIIDRLQASLQTVIYMPEVRDALLARGIDPAPSTPEEFVSYLKAETNKWQKVVKFANLKQ